VLPLTPPPPGVAAAGEEEALLDLFDGDREAVRELASLFLDQAPHYVARIRRAVEDRDNAGLRQALHSLNGAAGNFGAADLRRAVEALSATGNLEERAGQERGQERIRALELRLDGLCDLLRTLIGALASPAPDPAGRPT
jgi:HPt (histidine-containing phosphotransfer) domain-containing protein